MLSPKFILLSHSREITKSSNSGQLVLKTLASQSQRILWHRKAEEQNLLNLISKLSGGDYALAYPVIAGHSDQLALKPALNRPEAIVLVDATWQQARKMFNQSPYLQQANQWPIAASGESQFKRRRHQIAGGLCTAECVQLLLIEFAQLESAKRLQQAFAAFNQPLR